MKFYVGEWSKKTDKPHGRGICIKNDGILMQYFKDGQPASGECIRTYNDGKVDVGSKRRTDGNPKARFRGTTYHLDGSTQIFER